MTNVSCQGLTPITYLNSQMNLAFAFNLDNFAKKYGVKSGQHWTVKVKKSEINHSPCFFFLNNTSFLQLFSIPWQNRL